MYSTNARIRSDTTSGRTRDCSHVPMSAMRHESYIWQHATLSATQHSGSTPVRVDAWHCARTIFCRPAEGCMRNSFHTFQFRCDVCVAIRDAISTSICEFRMRSLTSRASSALVRLHRPHRTRVHFHPLHRLDSLSTYEVAHAYVSLSSRVPASGLYSATEL
jgi:hypothetical protein